MQEPTYTQGSGGIIRRGDKILLLKRIMEPYSSHWAIPVGHMEVGESYHDTIAREIKEETGMSIISANELGANVDHAKQFETHIFLVETKGHPKNMEPHKHSDMKWFKLNSLPEKIGSTTVKALELLRT